jgi:serine protease Do
MGIGFAIPINMVKTVEQQLVTKGKVVRGYLGIRIQELTRALAQSLHIDATEGVLVADVSKGSPAAKAGLKRGDVIVSLNGYTVQEPGQLRNVVAMTAPGTQITMQLLRDNKKQELTATLGELPREQTAARAGEETQSPRLAGWSQILVPSYPRDNAAGKPWSLTVHHTSRDTLQRRNHATEIHS